MFTKVVYFKNITVSQPSSVVILIDLYVEA